MYSPKPVDTSNVILPDGVYEVADKIAEQVHDIWAVGRINDGWTYGPVRDDAKKEHPCLVPYSQLTDSEKAYDYNTAIGTLKLILALGYKIIKE